MVGYKSSEKEVFKFPIDQIVCEKLTTTILADKT